MTTKLIVANDNDNVVVDNYQLVASLGDDFGEEAAHDVVTSRHQIEGGPSHGP